MKVYKLAQAAVQLGISTSTLRNHINRHRGLDPSGRPLYRKTSPGVNAHWLISEHQLSMIWELLHAPTPSRLKDRAAPTRQTDAMATAMILIEEHLKPKR